MLAYSILYSSVFLVYFSACGIVKQNSRDVTYAIEGQKSATIPLVFKERETNLNLVAPEFTILSFEKNKKNNSHSFNSPSEGSHLNLPFDKISVVPTSISTPNKHTAVTRTLKEIQAYNSESKCQASLNDLAEVKEHLVNSIVVCEKEFAAMINSAAALSIDSEQKTNWVKIYSDFQSARLIIHNF